MDDENSKHEWLGFDTSLEEKDYGFILGADGELKGIWIPKGMDDQDVPDVIVDLLQEKWGIDPNDNVNYGTIH